jgi:hypothetical protein
MSDFEVSDICRGFLEKIANSLVCNMWKVDTRPASASDFFNFLCFYEMAILVKQIVVTILKFLTSLSDNHSGETNL